MAGQNEKLLNLPKMYFLLQYSWKLLAHNFGERRGAFISVIGKIKKDGGAK